MNLERTIFIPENRRIIIGVPSQIPTGAPAGIRLTWPVLKKRTPVSQYFDMIPAETFGSGVVYQRRLRDEWNE